MAQSKFEYRHAKCPEQNPERASNLRINPSHLWGNGSNLWVEISRFKPASVPKPLCLSQAFSWYHRDIEGRTIPNEYKSRTLPEKKPTEILLHYCFPLRGLHRLSYKDNRKHLLSIKDQDILYSGSLFHTLPHPDPLPASSGFFPWTSWPHTHTPCGQLAIPRSLLLSTLREKCKT